MRGKGKLYLGMPDPLLLMETSRLSELLRGGCGRTSLDSIMFCMNVDCGERGLLS